MSLNLLSIVVLLSACGPETLHIGDVDFGLVCIEAGAGENAIVISDVDQDDHLDLIVANQSANSVVVFLGDGQGSFSEKSSTLAGENPTDVIAADVNADGTIDLILANHETSYLTLLIGDGDGKFQNASNSPLMTHVDPHPHAVGAQDLDGDGTIDLIVDDRFGNGLRVFTGLGNGQFAKSGTLINVGGDPYRGFAMGDLNGDGRLDIVTPNPNAIAVMIHTDTEDVGYASPIIIESTRPFAVALADLNGDANLDIVSAAESGNTAVRVFLGNGQAEFAEASESGFQMASGAKDVAVGDINGDGFDDVLVSSWSSDVLFILGGAESLQAVQIPGVEVPWGLAMGDLNEDGRDDFVIANGRDKDVRVYLSSER
jgi:FG-GAP-like repeat